MPVNQAKAKSCIWCFTFCTTARFNLSITAVYLGLISSVCLDRHNQVGRTWSGWTTACSTLAPASAPLHDSILQRATFKTVELLNTKSSKASLLSAVHVHVISPVHSIDRLSLSELLWRHDQAISAVLMWRDLWVAFASVLTNVTHVVKWFHIVSSWRK